MYLKLRYVSLYYQVKFHNKNDDAMKTITVSEFRKNIRKYAELASEEKVLVNRGEGKSFLIVPIENINDNGYNPEFVKRVLASKDEASKGKFTKVNNINDLWADIL